MANPYAAGSFSAPATSDPHEAAPASGVGSRLAALAIGLSPLALLTLFVLGLRRDLEVDLTGGRLVAHTRLGRLHHAKSHAIGQAVALSRHGDAVKGYRLALVETDGRETKLDFWYPLPPREQSAIVNALEARGIPLLDAPSRGA